ncbi:chemotaxis protein CheW [Oceanobacillus jordanicus]|uniref:Chemotaxis protein CheW n=1 Tax=Oceanobacillus jordanicus TaxID=2867266 RepID=A0AAW5BAG9_9BACI|nr:chemotaxis protein CheW [Oceanobacillus jordanicus]
MKDVRKFIVFTLKNQSYGVDVSQVHSIERLQKVTEVPRTASFIKGVIYLRGNTIPVIDLRERLWIGQTDTTDESRFLIVEIKGMQVGLLVDAANEVLDIGAEAIEPPPEMIAGVEARYLEGVAKLKDELLILLDLEHILDMEEVQEVKQAIN